jgi:FkbM family methyltransferase
MYSQNDEESIVTGYFKTETGRLLDIGAYDGVSFSNSRRLLELGWSGALVEPLPEAARKCRELYRTNSVVSVHEYAIGPDDRRVTFHTSDMMSTIDAAYEIHRRKWHSLTFAPIEVEQITLETLWTLVGRSFAFISIDVENYNIDLVRQLPEDVWRSLRCLCVEHDGHVEEIQRIAKQYGLTTIGHNGENLILATGE